MCKKFYDSATSYILQFQLLLIFIPFTTSSYLTHGEKGQSVRVMEDYEQDWGRVFRLISISGVATLASMGNIFTISAIMVDDLLRKKGNSFLVSIALADLLVTAIALPASSVAILGEMEDSENICRLQYSVTSMSCLTGAIFTGVIGIENFLRLKSIRHNEESRERHAQEQQLQQQHHQQQSQHSTHHHNHHPHHSIQVSQYNGQASASTGLFVPPPQKESICTVFQITVLNLIVWLMSGIIVLIHFIFMPQLMYAVCDKPRHPSPFSNTRLYEQLLFESLSVLGICLLSFVILGGFGYSKTICIIRSWKKPKPYLTSREFALVSTNFYNWLVRFLIWLPSFVGAIFCLLNQSENRSLEFQHRLLLMTTVTVPSSSISSTDPTFSDSFLTFQRLIIWPALLPACLSCVVNMMTNRDLRRCYVQFFNYFCCKTSVTTLTRRSRDPLRSGGDVRVHIIPGYNMYSSSVGHGASNELSSSTTQTRFNIKCGPIRMHCKRDIYEL